MFPFPYRPSEHFQSSSLGVEAAIPPVENEQDSPQEAAPTRPRVQRGGCVGVCDLVPPGMQTRIGLYGALPGSAAGWQGIGDAMRSGADSSPLQYEADHDGRDKRDDRPENDGCQGRRGCRFKFFTADRAGRGVFCDDVSTHTLFFHINPPLCEPKGNWSASLKDVVRATGFDGFGRRPGLNDQGSLW